MISSTVVLLEFLFIWSTWCVDSSVSVAVRSNTVAINPALQNNETSDVISYQRILDAVKTIMVEGFNLTHQLNRPRTYLHPEILNSHRFRELKRKISSKDSKCGERDSKFEQSHMVTVDGVEKMLLSLSILRHGHEYESVQSILLWFYVESSSLWFDKVWVTLTQYKRRENGTYSHHGAQHFQISKPSSSKYIKYKLDTQAALFTWLVEDKNHLLSLETSYGMQDHPPFLEVVIDEESLQRQKRNPSCSLSSRDQSCCLKEIRVYLEDIGLDSYIIYPRSFVFAFCSGVCHYREYSDSRKFSSMYLQGILGDEKYDSKPCCIPAATKPLSALIASEHQVRHHTIENIVVTSCGCA